MITPTALDIRIASTGMLFKFQLKDGSKFRAVLIEGIWREDLDRWPVDLGAPRSPAGLQPVDGLGAALHRLSRLEPWLLKRRWYPMTYMLMQGAKTSAAALADELEQWPDLPVPGKAHQPRHAGAGDRLRVERLIGFTEESVIGMRGMRIWDFAIRQQPDRECA